MSVSLKLALYLVISTITYADRFCNLSRRSGCSAPFAPGHKNMGSSWWAIGDKKFNTNILTLKTSLRVPEAIDNTTTGVMAINTAMENSDVHDETDSKPTRQTFQTLTAAYPAGWDGRTTNAKMVFAAVVKIIEWCTFASLYSRDRDPNQLTQAAFKHGAGTVDLSWEYQMGSTNIIQKASSADNSLKGPLVALAEEAPFQFWPKTECQCSGKGWIPAHSYENTVIKLATAVPDWPSSISTKDTTNTEPHTEDGGVTWTIEEIVIQNSYCDNPNSCPDPTFDATGTLTNGQDTDPDPTNDTPAPSDTNTSAAAAPSLQPMTALNDTSVSLTFIPPQEDQTTTADITLRDSAGHVQGQSIPCNGAWVGVTSFITPFVTSVRAKPAFCDNGDISAIRFKYGSYDIWLGNNVAKPGTFCGTGEEGKGAVGCVLLLKP